jgi:uncharacterized Zn finger protein
MARGWDDRWHSYPPSLPLPAEDGIATTKQRGPMATTWWSRRFTEVLESYGLGGRMQRGRRYARTGQVVSLDVAPGVIAAQVQGSRRTPYLVTITLREPTEAQWKRIDRGMQAKVGFVARLLGGEVPPDLEEVFTAAGVSLFPAAWGDLRSTCSCPDWENPCKHIAAVLYVFADRLDLDPWLVLNLRGRSREAVLAAFTSTSARPATGAATEIAPWWPFAPGAMPVLPESGPITAAIVADQPDAILDTLEALDVAIGATTFTEMVRPIYEWCVARPVERAVIQR